ncbi:MAG: cytochrome C [Candidatus Omnitrophica bacterium CG11_big_fil_rev_8_21_14_0_20_45_26]|uniref:Cytochrome C n=1 Tax=Candidatus Abzuiibacterium crystallinum TaxID=1974748 RepID=A0A2H0LRN2_9BACT|nr:MAG: cytochrome C [Candidatus Omnitrophica bacterium CG11_big_fil_rev_8_21_14_0_20_45_26]PIW65700.1 MAG: cytochrome C [Candidatus Omnitrophica bacterium CG12_big_fil_rev_8_21_14_0_65_45_16]
MNNQPEPKNQPRSLFQNWLSVIGAILSSVFFAVILVFVTLDFLGKEHNPYLGAVTYLILPIFLTIGLLLIPIGAFRERSKRQKRGYVRRFPHIDFNNPLHQKWAYTSIAIVTAFLIFSMFGAFRAYEFTESVTFCGKMCHVVMEPEYVAYHHSPHARVTCAECHIGPGADWFIKSKLSGSYQIYSVIANKFSRPIETPVKNLRPAQETCEQCHWPQKFFGAIEQDYEYFLPDENNTPWQTRMLMFVGGGAPQFGKRGGIHWHMNINNKMYYIAADEKREKIPWIKMIGPDGTEQVFVDEESEYSSENPPKGELRRMDCMDCHNRPSHNYKSPSVAVNEAMAFEAIDRSLPYIKREAVKALTGEYETKEEAVTKIRSKLMEFYQKEYPEVWTGKQVSLKSSIDEVARIYEHNFFPEMNVSWKEYPNHIGHMIFPGCFRCHDGKHKTETGNAISHDCKSCHSIIAQGPPDMPETSVDGLEFKHPEDIEEMWKEMACYDCHTGGAD